ncbi:MAG: KEOPS complex subunit Pcc1 [Thermoplasmataceae archaeon]
MYKVRVSILDSDLRKYLVAMKPEEDRDIGRGKMRFVTENGESYVYIEAPDSVALRANISSITRWLVMIDKIVREVN